MLVMFTDDKGNAVSIDAEDVSAVEQSGEYVKVTFAEAHMSSGPNTHQSKEVFLSGSTAEEVTSKLNGAGA